jgi:mannan endo-1,4-beta-mannosidase
MNKTFRRLIIAGLALCLVAGAGVWFYKSQNPRALIFKKEIKYFLTSGMIPREKAETEGLGEVKRVELYENNCLVSRKYLDFLSGADYKKVYLTEDRKRLVDYPKGYQIDLPADVDFDFDYGAKFVTATSDTLKAVISKEYSPYDDVQEYLNYYQNRFILNETYRAENRITLLEDTRTEQAGYHVWRIDTRLEEMPDGQMDGYCYLTLRKDTRDFYRIMITYDSKKTDIQAVTNQIIDQFKIIPPEGNAKFYLDWKPELPKGWSDETKRVYEDIKNSGNLHWGIFAEDVYHTGIETRIPEIEQKVEYKFPVILSYLHFGTDFPTEFMQNNYDDGRLVELTYQVTDSNNEKLFGYTPQLDIYRGKYDDTIREFARQAKAFGHPFLFRLNNEMNSDWTSYSGIINMSDPDIYIAVWQRFYEIFEEEGVDNAIWIYNPNDRNYPPCNWNDFTAYYPGNEYVQLVGVTGYNNGTYYKEKLEEWREFDTIYSEIQTAYEPFFSRFPWIITEFSSSSIGGDKVAWIDSMFKNIGKYKNIKIAVWFSYADFDTDPKTGKKIEARPYRMDETPETLEAFRRGLREYGVEGWK